MPDRGQNPLRGISDAVLFEMMARRDDSGLSELYDRYSARFYGLALKILNDTAAAEDVVQELFLSLWQNATKFDQRRGSPGSWMMIMCRNRCIDKLRAMTNRQQRSSAIDFEQLNAIAADESDNPFNVVNQNEIQKQIQGALEQLPEEQRQPIALSFFEGLSQTEIAGKLDLPLGTVKTRVRLGMQKLREMMISPTRSEDDS